MSLHKVLPFKFKRCYKLPLIKLQSSKLYNNKYLMVSTQTANTEIFAFTVALVFTLLSRKVLFIRRKDNRNS